MSNDTNLSKDSVWSQAYQMDSVGSYDLSPLSEDVVIERRTRRDLLITGSALTALLFSIFTLFVA